MKRALKAAAAVVAALLLVSLPWPPSAQILDTPADDGAVSGAVHVHTNRSDGLSTPDHVAAAAARAGLTFLIFTDHGDGTTTPDPPAYRHGVLCIDGVEISTIGGHYIALDMPPAPYPLGGEARDVVDDVRRLGGFGIAAHAGSPKVELAWSDWSLPIDGAEIANLDEGWRYHLSQPGIGPKFDILRALLTYPIRGRVSMASLLSSSNATRRFDEAAARRPLVAMAGADVHAKLALRDADPGDNRFALPFPGYENVFRALAVRVRPGQPLSGDAAADARAIMTAIRNGRVHAVARGLAWPVSFTFSAEHAGGVAAEGDLIGANGPIAPNGPITLRVRSNAPEGFVTEIWHDGTVIHSGTGSEVVAATLGDGGAYRVEIRADARARRPAWILSNPIYVFEPGPAPTLVPPERVVERRPLFDGTTLTGWRSETDETSLAAVDLMRRIEGAVVALRYGLSGGTPIGQFAAAGVHVEGGISNYTDVAFRASADRPMRVSVRARATIGDTLVNESWQRSVYLDTEPRTVTIPFSDMRPVGETTAPLPVGPKVYSLVFVVGHPNTPPGQSGWVYIAEATLQKREN